MIRINFLKFHPKFLFSSIRSKSVNRKKRENEREEEEEEEEEGSFHELSRDRRWVNVLIGVENNYEPPFHSYKTTCVPGEN